MTTDAPTGEESKMTTPRPAPVAAQYIVSEMREAAFELENRPNCPLDRAVAALDAGAAEIRSLRVGLAAYESMFAAGEPRPGAHLRADGSPCSYLHGGGGCNKCGFTVRAEAKTNGAEIRRLCSEVQDRAQETLDAQAEADKLRAANELLKLEQGVIEGVTITTTLEQIADKLRRYLDLDLDDGLTRARVIAKLQKVETAIWIFHMPASPVARKENEK